MDNTINTNTLNNSNFNNVSNNKSQYSLTINKKKKPKFNFLKKQSISNKNVSKITINNEESHRSNSKNELSCSKKDKYRKRSLLETNNLFSLALVNNLINYVETNKENSSNINIKDKYIEHRDSVNNINIQYDKSNSINNKDILNTTNNLSKFNSLVNNLCKKNSFKNNSFNKKESLFYSYSGLKENPKEIKNLLSNSIIQEDDQDKIISPLYNIKPLIKKKSKILDNNLKKVINKTEDFKAVLVKKSNSYTKLKSLYLLNLHNNIEDDKLFNKSADHKKTAYNINRKLIYNSNDLYTNKLSVINPKKIVCKVLPNSKITNNSNNIISKFKKYNISDKTFFKDNLNKNYDNNNNKKKKDGVDILNNLKVFKERLKAGYQNKKNLRYKLLLKPRNYWMVFKIIFKTCKLFNDIAENIKVYGTSKEIAIYCRHRENFKDLYDIQKRLVKMNLQKHIIGEDFSSYFDEDNDEDYIIEFNKIDIKNNNKDFINELIFQKESKISIPKYIIKDNVIANMCYALVYLLIIFFVPIRLAYFPFFYLTEKTDEYLYFTFFVILLDICMIFELILEFFRLHYLVNSLSNFSFKKNVKKYVLSKQFCLDFVQALPYGLIETVLKYKYINNSLKLNNRKYYTINKITLNLDDYIHIISLIRILKIYKYKKRLSILFSDIQDLLNINASVATIYDYIIKTLIVVHIFSCIWILIGFLGIIQNYESSWIIRFNLQDTTNLNIYLYSIYFSLTVLSTSGFGDITAVSNLEIIITILWMFFCGLIYSNSVSKLITFVTNLNAESLKTSKNIDLATEFCSDYKFPVSLQNKIYKNIELMSASNNINIQNKQELFEDIPLALKIQITTDISKNVMETIPFFSNKDNVFNATILPMLQPVHLIKKEFVYKIYDIAHTMYFIEDGTVSFSTKHNLSYKLIKKGFYFGDVELMLKISRISNATCYTNCKFLSMNRDILFNVIGNEFLDVFNELDNDAPLKYNKDIEVIKAREKIYKINLINSLKINSDSNNSQNNNMCNFLAFDLKFNKSNVKNNVGNTNNNINNNNYNIIETKNSKDYNKIDVNTIKEVNEEDGCYSSDGTKKICKELHRRSFRLDKSLINNFKLNNSEIAAPLINGCNNNNNNMTNINILSNIKFIKLASNSNITMIDESNYNKNFLNSNFFFNSNTNNNNNQILEKYKKLDNISKYITPHGNSIAKRSFTSKHLTSVSRSKSKYKNVNSSDKSISNMNLDNSILINNKYKSSNNLSNYAHNNAFNINSNKNLEDNNNNTNINDNKNFTTINNFNTLYTINLNNNINDNEILSSTYIHAYKQNLISNCVVESSHNNNHNSFSIHSEINKKINNIKSNSESTLSNIELLINELKAIKTKLNI